jgi:hypothetical protein
LVDVSKRYLMQVAAHNLGIVMRYWFGVGTPRGLQGARPVAALTLAWQLLFGAFQHAYGPLEPQKRAHNR